MRRSILRMMVFFVSGKVVAGLLAKQEKIFFTIRRFFDKKRRPPRLPIQVAEVVFKLQGHLSGRRYVVDLCGVDGVFRHSWARRALFGHKLQFPVQDPQVLVRLYNVYVIGLERSCCR